mmetsp:Transcript_3546/g.7344  ORF Transcript_3546/g.7344 Transcript_3546/m.7344 type:complete len:318 (-) Transcript_3546:101-1054(-)
MIVCSLLYITEAIRGISIRHAVCGPLLSIGKVPPDQNTGFRRLNPNISSNSSDLLVLLFTVFSLQICEELCCVFLVHQILYKHGKIQHHTHCKSKENRHISSFLEGGKNAGQSSDQIHGQGDDRLCPRLLDLKSLPHLESAGIQQNDTVGRLQQILQVCGQTGHQQHVEDNSREQQHFLVPTDRRMDGKLPNHGDQYHVLQAQCEVFSVGRHWMGGQQAVGGAIGVDKGFAVHGNPGEPDGGLGLHHVGHDGRLVETGAQDNRHAEPLGDELGEAAAADKRTQREGKVIDAHVGRYIVRRISAPHPLCQGYYKGKVF